MSSNGWFQLEQKKMANGQSGGSKPQESQRMNASVSRQSNMVRIPIDFETEAAPLAEPIVEPQAPPEQPTSVLPEGPPEEKAEKQRPTFHKPELAVAVGGHTLPPLPYAYDALEPVISAETLRIHHDKHHKKYVDDLNQAELALVDARAQGDFQYIKFWEGQLAFNGSGHILHSVYWAGMTSPDQGGSPGEHTLSYLNWYFGGLKAFKEQFGEAAKKVAGSGWCVLGYSPSFFRLEVLQSEKHENLTQWGIIPILVCDVWEHAYYLQYQNDRGSYVDAWWRLVNWREVEERLAKASQGILPIR